MEGGRVLQRLSLNLLSLSEYVLIAGTLPVTMRGYIIMSCVRVVQAGII